MRHWSWRVEMYCACGWHGERIRTSIKPCRKCGGVASPDKPCKNRCALVTSNGRNHAAEDNTMDIFDRIVAAIELILAGAKKDAQDLLAHIDAIDGHLGEDITHDDKVDDNLRNGDETVNDEDAHVAVIHAGLQKIIEASQTPVTGADEPSTSDEPPAGTPLTADELAANTPPAGNDPAAPASSDAPASPAGETTADEPAVDVDPAAPNPNPSADA